MDFRDTARIASGSPEMWRDIAIESNTWARWMASLLIWVPFRPQARRLKTIVKFLKRQTQRRDNWCSCCVSPSPE